jgi:hypothetical protein
MTNPPFSHRIFLAIARSAAYKCNPMYRSQGEGTKAMKKFAVVLSVVIGAWISSPTPEAQAWSFSNWSSGGQRGDSGHSGHRGRSGHSGHSGRSGHSGHRGGKASVPELDPSAAGGAMILLLGGVAYISSRRREDDLV